MDTEHMKNLKFLKDKKVDGYIPNQKQSRQNKGKKPSNPYHKDYFTYDNENDDFIYLMKHYIIKNNINTKAKQDECIIQTSVKTAQLKKNAQNTTVEQYLNLAMK